MAVPRLLRILALALCGALAPAAPAAGASAPYAQQQLTWEPCPGAETLPLQCARMTVPVDWDRPQDGRDITVTVSRLPAADPAHRRGALFTNPGGPGLPGRLFPLLWLQKPQVHAVYDVVGMDPRGSGLSTPVRCVAHPPDLPGDLRDRSRVNLDALRARALVGAAACVEPARGLARHMSTRQMARDIDLLRTLLGEERIVWFGSSAGGWLGAWYAAEFPGRVERMVLDGTVDLTGTWYAWQTARPRAFQRKFDSVFLPWIASHHAVYGYGATTAEAAARWEARRSALAGQPLALSPECTLRPTEFEQTTWQALLAPPAAPNGFRALARALALIERADALTPEERAWLVEHVTCQAPSGVRVEDAADILASEGVLCGDTPSPDYGRWQADSAELGKAYPLTGWWHEVLGGYCAFWPFPPTGKPDIPGAPLPPVLMVHNELDPVTPLEGAVRTSLRIPSAHLLVVRGESAHTIYGQGNDCADGHVDAFLLTGALPPPGAACQGAPLPEPT